MALTSYAELKAEIADWLNRTDLTTQIPTFIALAEAEMKRRIRKWSVYSAAFSVNEAREAVPADCSVLRSIKIISGTASRDVPLKIGTIEQLNEVKARYGTTGRPTQCAVVDGYIYFAPAPDATYTMELFYFSTLTPLSSAVASNSVLVEAPDAYLFGALAQAAQFLEHDDRVPMWEGKFLTVIEQLNAKREEDEFNASLKDIRLPVVFT